MKYIIYYHYYHKQWTSNQYIVIAIDGFKLNRSLGYILCIFHVLAFPPALVILALSSRPVFIIFLLAIITHFRSIS